MNFKERVASVAITEAQKYKDTFVDYDYLICSTAFSDNGYYVISSNEDNFQHLVGVNTPNLTPNQFFDKCLSGSLTENDFNFKKPGRSEKNVKGAVRSKIKSLPHLTSMIGENLYVQENFHKNKVSCSFAATDTNMTIGYINNNKAIPRSLMSGDETDKTVSKPVDLILRRRTGEKLFSEIIYGDKNTFNKYQNTISEVVSGDIYVIDTNKSDI